MGQLFPVFQLIVVLSLLVDAKTNFISATIFICTSIGLWNYSNFSNFGKDWWNNYIAFIDMFNLQGRHHRSSISPCTPISWIGIELNPDVRVWERDWLFWIHRKYYQSCRNKCKTILTFLENNYFQNKTSCRKKIAKVDLFFDIFQFLHNLSFDWISWCEQ